MKNQSAQRLFEKEVSMFQQHLLFTLFHFHNLVQGTVPCTKNEGVENA